VKGKTDFNEQLFYNKEWWYRQVIMPPRKVDEASSSLLSVLKFLWNHEGFKEYVTADFVKHIAGWARHFG